MSALALFALELLALVGDFAGFLFGFHHVESVAGLGSAVEAEDEGGGGGTGFFDAVVTFVEHSLDAAEVAACQHDVADAEGAVLHQHVGHVAAALVEGGFDDGAGGAAVGVGFELEEFGFEQHLLHEFFHADALLGGDVLRLVFAAPFFHQVVHGGKFFFNLVGVGVGLIYLVDSEDDRHVGGGSVVDSFHGLGHDAVVGGHDDDTDVGDLGAAGTHGGERFVARGVEEGDVTAVAEAHRVGADVLSDAAGLTGDDVRLADVVQQRGFAVVDVTHDGDNRRTGYEVFLLVLFLLDGVGHFGGDVFGVEAEFFGHDVDGFGIEALVD